MYFYFVKNLGHRQLKCWYIFLQLAVSYGNVSIYITFFSRKLVILESIRFYKYCCVPPPRSSEVVRWHEDMWMAYKWSSHTALNLYSTCMTQSLLLA